MFGWLLVGVCPSFHCFHIGSRGASLVGGVLWVWLGGTLLLLQFRTAFCGLGTLLGPEGTPVCGGCVLGAAPGLDGLTHGFSVWWLRWCWGVVVC